MVVFGSKKVKFGVKGFEPLNVGIKNRCLSTWLYSKKFGLAVRTHQPDKHGADSTHGQNLAARKFQIYREKESR